LKNTFLKNGKTSNPSDDLSSTQKEEKKKEKKRRKEAKGGGENQGEESRGRNCKLVYLLADPLESFSLDIEGGMYGREGKNREIGSKATGEQ